MSDFGCPLAYLQNMVDADVLPVEVLNALKENYCDEEGAKDTWDLVEKAELEAAQEEIEELKTSLQTTTSYHTDRYELLEDENKKLKELTDGIMEQEDTGHIQGTNAYEKFCQAICELDYDEKWISELKEENRKLKQKTTKSVRRQKYIHYKNLVLKHELDDVSDFEDEDYVGFGEKPYSK